MFTDAYKCNMFVFVYCSGIQTVYHTSVFIVKIKTPFLYYLITASQNGHLEIVKALIGAKGVMTV